MKNDSMNNPGRAGAAFTLTELLVSIAAIALLTTGVGRIFSSVGDLVSVGSAVSEIDQVARTLERQLREDFAAFNRMRSEETFFAIRMREVGDINHNGVLNVTSGEIPIYRSIEDRDADRRDIADGLIDGPYDEGSRAVTQRVDEMMFIGASGADLYSSFQVDPTSLGGDAISTHARIYYGHGLRPIPDPLWPPPNPLTDKRAPTRWFYIDGDFGTSANPSVADPLLSQNRFDPNNHTLRDKVTGRNEFSQQWPLVRQPLLLYGGEGAGFPPNAQGLINSPIGYDREITPFPRDIELEQRVENGGTINFIQVDTELDMETLNSLSPDRPGYARVRDGRVDVCAMSHLDVRRWLEGRILGDLSTGRPFGSGRLASLTGTDPMDMASANNALWIRDNNMVSAEANNLTAVQHAIAGMFSRIQVETAPPRIIRAPEIGRGEPLQPEDALMDLHAVLSTRCSNFEIAWGDASSALADLDFDGDGQIEIKWGEMIWYDVSPLQSPVSQPTDRSLFQNWSMLGGDLIDIQTGDLDTWNQSEISSSDQSGFDDNFFDYEGYYDDAMASDAGAMTGASGNVPDAGASAVPAYSTLLNGGAARRENETLVIFPFRKPNASGGWRGAWDKSMLIRIRVTLHDTLGRLPEGKDFEFIFVLNPQGF